MVRRATRLPPNATSLEEVVLNRIADGASSSQRVVPSVEARRMASSRRTTVRTTAPVASPSVSMKPSSEVGVAAASSGTLERIEAMATELTELNTRLQAVATTSAQPRMRRKPSARGPHVTTASDQIDQYIQSSVNNVYEAYAARKAEAQSAKKVSGTRAMHDPAKGAQVTYAVREMRSTVRRLDKVFYEVATGDKQRHLAATKIATLIRGFITRRRYRKMKYALGMWRARKCAILLTYMEQFSAREEFLNKQILRLQEERTQSLLRRVIAEIRDVALMNLPMRRRQAEETERRFLTKQLALMRMVYVAWKGSALGPRSRKRVSAEAKARHLAARQRLEALERFDIITNEMVHEEFLKENIRIVRAKHPFYMLKTYFSILLHQEYLPIRHKMAVAVAHECRKLLRLIWSVWLPFFRAAQVDRAISKANERRTLDRFDKHHNLRKIDAHYRRTHVRKHLIAWAVYCQRIRRVRKLFEDNTKENMTTLLRRWHVRSKYQRKLRANAIEEWKAYSRRIFQTPFRAWYNYAADRRANRQAKEAICVAYQRRARRHTKYAFFRLWKHQVLFGNIESLHSKIHLIRSLEDQKRVCLALEANARLYQENIGSLQHTIAQLEARVSEKQVELLQVHDATQSTRFSLHSAEQSIARVQGMLEAVRQVHPGTLDRIEKMFAENPLLTRDLQEVVAMHVNKRREVLEKIELDDMEMEIQNATDGDRRAVSRDDQLLLHRAKWVFSRLDLQPHRVDGKLTSGAVPIAPMDQLCALFEFIRSGQTEALTLENDPSHPRDERREREATEARARVDRSAFLAQSETWHGFLKTLTVKFAPERMLRVKERLVKRNQEMEEQLSDFKDHKAIYNAYSGSAHPRRSSTQEDRTDVVER